MKPKLDQGRSKVQDGAAHSPRRAWPFDVMVSAAAMVVDEKLPVARVSEKLGVPYTTLFRSVADDVGNAIWRVAPR